MYLAVAILRVEKGLDYAQILGEDSPRNLVDIPRTLQPNDSSADLLATEKNAQVHGSLDSLSRNVSQGKFRFSLPVSVISRGVGCSSQD